MGGATVWCVTLPVDANLIGPCLPVCANTEHRQKGTSLVPQRFFLPFPSLFPEHPSLNPSSHLSVRRSLPPKTHRSDTTTYTINPPAQGNRTNNRQSAAIKPARQPGIKKKYHQKKTQNLQFLPFYFYKVEEIILHDSPTALQSWDFDHFGSGPLLAIRSQPHDAMADQCIVCLENLDVETNPDAIPPTQQQLIEKLRDEHARLAVEDPDALAELNEKSTASALDSNNNHVAQIPVCGHMLHDACLREWSEKANSCPICRQTFHIVTVFDKVGGKFLTFKALATFWSRCKEPI